MLARLPFPDTLGAAVAAGVGGRMNDEQSVRKH
jgi:hypothetical protein